MISVVLAVAVAGATAAGSAATADRTVVVADAESGTHLLEVPADDGDEVTLSYTHSVEKTPIEDIYVVDGTALRMDRMVFHSHGAGLPTDSQIEQTDEGFVLELDDTYEELGVVPGSIAGHELVVDGERYDLVALSDGPVTISVADRSLGDAIADHVLRPTLEMTDIRMMDSL
ncbi:DUF1850 domain-containing protein [Natronococcus pandeyae]|uniref:DUF1850 domain-containing protein n=1 Tax=Natronococcus pandeyae TaxID=2055836 RepID=UPI001F2D8EB7|nr:DUF1850 domain-containing protein [Natronococcus pandeyae]